MKANGFVVGFKALRRLVFAATRFRFGQFAQRPIVAKRLAGPAVGLCGLNRLKQLFFRSPAALEHVDQ